MVEPDTIKLLRECDAGIKMGISAIDDVIDYVAARPLAEALEKNRNEHNKLREELEVILEDYQDDGKEPAPIAKGMSKMKTSMKLAMHESDQTIAELITDGCNMGVKSLSQYLNQYKAAEEKVKDIAKKLIHLEEELAEEMRAYL